jgi:TetR/AcrR family transcriptional regulator
MPQRKSQRRQQILEALAEMLEANPGDRITTARLAERVGVSEAALYRHFPSKSKMFEGLIEFIEDSLFERIALILREQSAAAARCEHMLGLLLSFVEHNPGISRIMTGDALAGENPRLHQRVVQLFERYETQLRQVLRDAEVHEGLRPVLPLPAAANLLMASAEGRMTQFVRSGFRRSPTADWPAQLAFLFEGFFREVPRPLRDEQGQGQRGQEQEEPRQEPSAG